MSDANTGTTLMSKLIAYTDGYYQLALYSLIAGVVLIITTPLIRRLMQEVK
jgi:POT family proton-dependent oligopeptide transporter